MRSVVLGVICMGVANLSTSLAPPDDLPSPPFFPSEPASSKPKPLPLEPSSQAPPQLQVCLQIHVYRVYGDISGKTSFTKNLWSDIKSEKGKLKEEKDQFVFFTLADLNVSGVKLKVDENGWTWDGEKNPPENGKVKEIASPKVRVSLSQVFEMYIGQHQPIEYFEKQSDGLFELKRAKENTGFKISARIEEADSERILFRNLNIQLRSIEKRIPIEGVSLDVGLPIVSARECTASIAVKPGRDFGIQINTEGHGFLIMRYRAELLKPE